MSDLADIIFYNHNGRLAAREFFLIAGPCVIESEKMCLRQAALLQELCRGLSVPFIFKSSFDKANRSSYKSFRGPGIKNGLGILAKVRRNLKIPVCSDVHESGQLPAAKNVLDIIQIPALLSRQTDLLYAAARSGKIVNVKKGQFMAPWEMANAVKKIEYAGNRRILLTERGVCFGYNNLVGDMRSIPLMREFGYPVVFDATHSVQLPAAAKDKSSGERRFAAVLALAASAAGCDGLFIETHEHPQKALCDGPNMVDFPALESILRKAKKIHEIARA